MSVYKGKRYVREQIDSIITQNFDGKLVIYIRDDGSPDDTLEYIKDYKAKVDAPIIIYSDENKGAAGSFWEAIHNAPGADYYAFCDQDDVWVQGKVEAALSAITQYDKVPTLWISNYTVVDLELNPIIKDVIQNPVDSDRRVLFYNNVPGCTMIFNRFLINEMRKIKIDRIRMHDIVALNIALLTGYVIFEPKSYVMYRQHDSNVLGYGHKKVKLIKWIVEKIHLMKEKEPYSISEYADQIIKQFDLLNEQKEDYVLIRDYKQSLHSRLKLLKKDFTKAPISRTSLSIRSKILFKLM